MPILYHNIHSVSTENDIHFFAGFTGSAAADRQRPFPSGGSDQVFSFERKRKPGIPNRSSLTQS